MCAVRFAGTISVLARCKTHAAPSAAFLRGDRLSPAQREIFGFRTHKPVVNIPAIGDVKDARGENRPPRVATRAHFNAGRLCTCWSGT
jgi:hypothetical protein